MFTIQYRTANGEHKTQELDSRNRRHLVKHLARFELPIVAVYEQATVITKAVRAELTKFPSATMSRAAKEFAANT